MLRTMYDVSSLGFSSVQEGPQYVFAEDAKDIASLLADGKTNVAVRHSRYFYRD